MVVPSTCSKAAQSTLTGEARDAAFRLFLALVNMGQVTRLLLWEITWAGAASPTIVLVSTDTAKEAVSVFTSAGRGC